MFSLKTREARFSIARFAVEATSDAPDLLNSSSEQMVFQRFQCY